MPHSLDGEPRQKDQPRAVPTGEETSHQHVGVDGRSVYNQNIHEGEETSSRQTEDGQHHSRGVCEPHGWHQVPKLSRLCEAAMDLMPCKRNISFGRTPHRCEQRDCRLSVQVSLIISRVETESISVQGDVPQTRSLQDRPLRNSTECSIGEVYELEARSVCSGNGCSTSLLERSAGVCFPSLLPHRQVSEQVEDRAIRNSFDCPSMARPAVVPHTARDTGGLPNPIANVTRPTNRSLQPTTPITECQGTSASRLEGVRERIHAGGISEQATKLITAAWSKGTNTAYQSAWSKWTSWCVQKDLYPFSCRVSPLVNFLASLF